jgi:uncharacterized protein YeaO (DUF488 family)
MIRETYLAVKKRVVPPEDVVLDISRFRKKNENISPLAPSRELLYDWNQDRMTWKDYVERYYQELRENREAASLIQEIADQASQKDVWLVCLERGYPCHRFLVKQIIERMLVGRGVLQEPEDYSEHYNLCKNLTRSEIAARGRSFSRTR